MRDMKKLHRGAQQAQARPEEAKKQAPHEQAAAAPMPALGGSGDPLTGGASGEAQKAENDPAAMAEQQAELTRIKSLPAGSPELESYKKPEALGAAVPEGAGKTGQAKSQAEGMSPKTEQAAPASVGPNAQAVKTEMGGASVKVEKVDVPTQAPSSGPADQAVAHAGSPPAAPAAPVEVAAEAAAEPKKDEVAPEAAESKAPDAAPASAPTEVKGEAKAAADVEPAAAPVATPETPQAGDATAEAKSATKNPEKSPEAAPQAVAAAAPAVAEGQVEAPPEAQIAGPEQVADVAASGQAPAEVGPAAIAAQAGEQQVVAPAAVPEAVAGEKAAVAEEVVAPVAAGVAEAPQTAAPAAQAAAAPEAKDTAPAQAGEAQVAPVDSVAAAITSAPFDPVAEIAFDQAKSAEPTATSGGDAPAPEAAVPVEAAGEQVSAESQSADPAKGPEGEAPAAESSGDLAAAPAAAPGPAPSLEAPVVDVAAGAAPAAPAAEVGIQAPVQVETELGNQNAAGDLADPLAGQMAAGEMSAPVFGQTATQAAEEAQLEPAGVDPGAVESIAGVGADAGLDPSALVSEKTAEMKGKIDDLLKAGERAIKGIGKLQLPETMQKGLKGAKGQIDELLGDAEKMGQDLLGKGKDMLDQAEGALDNVKNLATDPGAAVAPMLGEGSELPGHLRQKAEQALGMDFSQVKLHEGKGAKELADRLGANAFAQGKDVVLGKAAEMAGADREEILAEELVHVAQMKGKSAADRGATGLSVASDRAEKSARTAAKKVLEGAEIKAEEIEGQQRAVFRNDGGTTSQQPEMPTQVSLSIAGKSQVVKLPKLTPGTTSKMVSLPSLGIQGMSFESQAKFQFDATTGKFTGGKAWASIQVGDAIKLEDATVTIEQSGQMKGSFPGATLTVGSLINDTITAEVGAGGVTGKGTYQYSQLRGGKLDTWLRSGSMQVNVGADGAVSGSGSLGMQVEPFTAGTIKGSIVEKALSGDVTIGNKNAISLGKSSVSEGQLTGKLTNSEKIDVSGSLKLDIPSLGAGTGSAQVKWDSDGAQISGEAAFDSASSSTWGKVAFTKATVTGSIAETKLPKVSGSGTAVYDSLFKGNWNGDLDLEAEKASFELGGELVAPIVQGEVQVSKGALTIKVENSELQSTAGNVDFKLGSFLKGTAVLEEGTNANVINATATAELVSSQTYDDVTLSKGSITVKVRGTTVEIVSGSVDMDYKGVAKGQLELGKSSDIRRFTGSGKANIQAPQQWGDIKVLEGAIDLSLKDNIVDKAQGNAKIGYLEFVEGQLAFDATKDFTAIDGTATSSLVAVKDLTSPLKLEPDAEKKFDLQFKNSTFKDFKGAFAWSYEKFKGDLNVAAPTEDFGLVTGNGKADLSEDLPIGTLGSTKLMGKAGGALTGKIDSGRFLGVSGTLKWEYDAFLAGDAQIAEPRTSINEIDGMLKATVIAAKNLPNNDKVEIQPGAAGALTIELRNSEVKRYSGTLDYKYDGFLQGQVTIAGDMLDFSQLAGQSAGTVFAKKNLKNVDVLEGSGMNVEFVNSAFTDFYGAIQFEHKEWLKGKADAVQGGGSSMANGVVGKVEGSLIKAPPGGQSTGFQYKEGGSIKTDLVAGMDVTTFDVGSEVNWQYDDWLSGKMTLEQKATILRADGSDPGAQLLKEKEISSDKKVVFLPSTIGVELVNGQPAKYSGSVKARYDQWIEGSFAIAASSGAQNFDGDLNGTLIKAMPLEGSPTELQAGGSATITVNSNNVTGISGTLAFQYGEGEKWLEGTINSAQSTGAGIKSISGDTTGSVILGKTLGNFDLETGGSINARMENSTIDKIGGSVAYKYGQGERWISGTVTLDEAVSTAARMSGTHDSSISKEHQASVNLKLMPSSGITGKVEQNDVKTVAGSINWQYEDWLAGTMQAAESEPSQVGGSGDARIIKDHDVIPGKLKLIPGSGFTAQITTGNLTNFSGDVPFQFEDWAKGSVNVSQATPDAIVGPAKFSVVAPGKTFDNGGFPVKMTPGGSLTAEMTANGLEHFGGNANAEIGTANAGDSWHVRGKLALENSELSTVKGDFDGALASPLKFPPSLRIQPGGAIRFHMEGSNLTRPAGDVNYVITKGEGGPEFVKGSLSIDASSTKTNINADLHGQIAQETDVGSVKILVGGQLDGRLTNNSNATLGGNLAFQYKQLAKGKIQVAGQFNPNDAKVNGEAEATTLSGQQAGALTIEAGSQIGAKVEESDLTQVWGKFNFSTDKLQGVIDVPRGGNSTPTVLSGEATAKLKTDLALGGGFALKQGSGINVKVESNNLTSVSGQVGWKYQDWLSGSLTAETGSTLTTINGSGTAQLDKRYAVGSTTFALVPGTGVSAKIANNAIDSVSGQVAWEYGEGGWLAGELTMPEGTKLDAPGGTATARLAKDKVFGNLALVQGGQLTVDIAAGAPTSFAGKLLWAYTNSDRWLEGDVTIDATPSLDSINGMATARLAKDKQIGDGLVLLKGGNLNGQMGSSVPADMNGEVNWRYQSWLEGKVTVQASSLETIEGQADAHIVEAKMVAPGFELQQGGNVKVTVGQSAFKTFTGEVNWKYGEGEPFAQGAVTVSAESAWDSINGKADAQLIQDVQAASDLTLLKEGSNLQVEVASSKVKSFGGSVSFLYGEEQWLKGNITANPDSTPKQISGEATAALVGDKPIDGTELTLKAGGSAKVTVDKNSVKNFGGTVNWIYGEDPWLKGSIVLDESSTPKKVSGEVTATLSKYKRVSDDVKLMEGGTLTAKFDGTSLKQFSGDLTLGYQDWLLGNLHVDNSTLEDVSGSIKASLRKHKPLTADLMLKQGGAITVELQNSKMLSFNGDVAWSYQQWLEGQMHVDTATGENVTGTGTASLVQQKQVGEGGKLELQRGSSLQAKFTNSQLDGLGGDVAWRWEDWLKGTVNVPAYTKIDNPSGTITAALDADKAVGNELTLKRGGNVGGELVSGKLSKISGEVEWQYQTWLGGKVTLNPSSPEALTGSASASVIVQKEVKPPLTIERGGNMQLDFDTKKSMAQQPFSANLTWQYEKWIGGDLQVNAGSTFENLSGKANATLREEKTYGEVLLRRGGQIRAEFAGSAPQSFGGDLNWQYQTWLAGSVNVADGSKLDNLSGQASASLLEDKALGNGFSLVAGGHAQVELKSNKVESFGGTVFYKWKDLVDGSLDVQGGSKLDKISGKGTAHLSKDYPVNGSELIVKQGTSLTAEVKDSSVDSVSGKLGWKYQQWVEGNVDVQSSKLDSVSGAAQARVVTEKQLGGSDLKLMPGGSIEVDVKNNALTSWGGSISIQYKDIAKGTLTVEGKTADLATVNGEAKARLINDLPLPGEVKLLNGSGVGVKVKAGAFDTFNGKVRFQYKDILEGAVELTDSKADNINGSASASVIKDFSPGGTQFFLTQGGNLRTEFKNSAFDSIEGEVTWKYDNPSAKMDGRLTIPKSNIKSISGEGTARLLQDSAPVQNTVIKAGGNLSVKVEASAPKSVSGRVDWQHSDWLGGYVELLEGTNITGPFKGKAGAVLLADKQINSKFTANKGGNINLQLDSSVAVDQTQISGMVAVQYEDWLKGSLTVDGGTTFKQIAGTAKVELIKDKDVGASGVKLLAGGNVQAKFNTQGLENFGGVVMVDYQDWLRGSINVNTGSTPDAITGKVTAQVSKEKTFGEFKLQQGGQVSVDMAASKLGAFGGVVNWQYQDWVNGTLTVDGASNFDSIGGQGSASLIKEKAAGGEVVLQQGGHLRAKVAQSKLSTFSGEVNLKYQDWLEGGVVIQGESNLDNINGNAHIAAIADKELAGQVTIKSGSAFQGQMLASKVTTISGNLNFEWKGTVGGALTVNAGSTLEKVSGSAQVALLKDVDVGAGVKLVKGGNAQIDFDGTDIKSLSGTLSLKYQDWLQGTIQAKTGSSLSQISGTAELSVKQNKSFGKIAIKEGSSLGVDFAANTVTEYRGNVEVGFDDWLKGNLNFKAQDLNTISGSGSLEVIKDKPIAGPVSILTGSYLRANVEASDLKDFGGTVKLEVKEWGRGELTVRDGSTTKSISGEGKIELTAPKKLGEYVTLTKANIGATVEANELKSIYGEAQGEVKELGTGWLKILKSSTLTEFDGQAGVKLTTPKKIGQFAELSGGQVIANFQKNSLKDFGGFVDITVYGWGKGNVTIDPGSTLEYIKGSAKLELTEPKSLAGGVVKITGGSVGATVDGQKLTHIAGSIKVQIKEDVEGELKGEIDVEKENVSGQGKLRQLRPWTAGPVKVQNAELSATVTDNKMTGASGKGEIDAGKYGRGGIDVNYEDVGGNPVFYGKGWVEFQPHDRIKGRLDVNLSREQKLTGEGQVKVKISDKINGMIGVALDEEGHVKLKGSVTIPGPFELFTPTPYKKDINLLDLSFVVYTPPTVKVKVGAGLGIECGIKPLTISNIMLGGEVDLMEPSFASMSVSAHLASSAYADLNAYVEGSVQVSAAVVAVEAGLRAALNLHLEAALSADPTITVNRNGLAFDMPVDARLTAALNLVLTFFAKVKVGLDVGLFSIMKTVWRYEKSPDPLRLAEMSIGAKGRVKADGNGFSGEMNPEYQPPDLSLDSLKRALHLD